jgi:capsular polysaccharide transport system permease protein
VRRAEQEVSERREGYRTALDQLNALQNRTAILDPKLRATETGTLLTNLLAEKLDVDARLFVLEQQAATDSPTVRQLRRTQEALKDQIENLRAELANSGTAADNLSSAFRRFSELETDRVLASELYAAARRNLAQAQVDAIRKAVYVTVFVPPALAGESRYPRRIAMPLLILIGLGVAWGVGALAWASVEDHRT